MPSSWRPVCSCNIQSIAQKCLCLCTPCSTYATPPPRYGHAAAPAGLGLGSSAARATPGPLRTYTQAIYQACYPYIFQNTSCAGDCSAVVFTVSLGRCSSVLLGGLLARLAGPVQGVQVRHRPGRCQGNETAGFLIETGIETETLIPSESAPPRLALELER